MSISTIGHIDASTLGAAQEPSGADFKAAVSQSRIGVTVEAGALGESKLDKLMEGLISVLRQPSSGGRPPIGSSIPQGPGPIMPGSFRPQGMDGSSRQHEAHLLQRVISLLNHQLDSGKLDQRQTSLVGKLLPLLEEKFVSRAEPQRHSGDGETKLLEKLRSALDGGASTQTSRTGGGEPAYDPSAGISGAEIDAMIANADGQGPEVNFAAWTRQPGTEQSAG